MRKLIVALTLVGFAAAPAFAEGMCGGYSVHTTDSGSLLVASVPAAPVTPIVLPEPKK